MSACNRIGCLAAAVGILTPYPSSGLSHLVPVPLCQEHYEEMRGTLLALGVTEEEYEWKIATAQEHK